MNPMNAELERLITNTIELRTRVIACVEEIDYVERTGAAPDQQKRALAEQLSRVIDGLGEQFRALRRLVED